MVSYVPIILTLWVGGSRAKGDLLVFFALAMRIHSKSRVSETRAPSLLTSETVTRLYLTITHLTELSPFI